MSLIAWALWLFLGFTLFLIIKDIVVYLKNKSRNDWVDVDDGDDYVDIKDFTCAPGDEEDGRRWYETHIKTAFKKVLEEDACLLILLDGVPGYAYGFLHGAFAPLALEFGYAKCKKH